MYCDHCGALLSMESKFCPQCGKRLDDEAVDREQRFPNLTHAQKAQSTWKPRLVTTIGVIVAMVAIVFVFVVYKSAFETYPSEAHARRFFDKQNREQINGGVIEVLRFKKINGQSSEINGIRLYTIEYEAEVKYPKGINSNCGGPGFAGWDCWFATLGGGQVKQKGEVEKVRDKITFERTEKGWKGPDGDIYSGSLGQPTSEAKATSERTNNPQTPSLPTVSFSNLRSLEDRVRTDMIFENRLREPVLIFWVNYQGQEILYRELNPQQRYSVQTFATHPWRIRLKRTNQAIKEVVANTQRAFVIVE